MAYDCCNAEQIIHGYLGIDNDTLLSIIDDTPVLYRQLIELKKEIFAINILITGAKGQIGIELVTEAIKRGHEIHGFGSKTLGMSNLEKIKK